MTASQAALMKELGRLGSHRRAVLLVQDGKAQLLTDPAHWISTADPSQVRDRLRRIEQLRRDCVLAGYLAYEMAPSLEPCLPPRSAPPWPLLEFGGFAPGSAPQNEPEAFRPQPYQIRAVRPDLEEAPYLSKIEQILGQIAAGNVYQINFTFRLRFEFEGDPRALFLELHRNQPVERPFLMRSGRRWILSLSPELFFLQQGEKILVRPMKGTLPRGRTLREDRRLMRQLRADEKNRAENLMIVDLLRNDLGRICRTGSVRVRRLFEIDRWPTVLQMSSRITGRLSAGITLEHLLEALFPCGSVTGAPKIAAMRLIHRLERAPRGVYCGALGMLDADRAVFNVGIRTLTLQQQDDRPGPVARYAGELGIGSGIVADSQPRREREESRLKAFFLCHSRPRFSLLESMRLESGRILRLASHLRRMQESARYFGFPFPRKRILERLKGLASQNPAGVFKLRLELGEEGRCADTLEPLSETPEPVLVALAAEPTLRQDRFLYHKTTHRPLYGPALEAARSRSLWDLLFCNAQGELTEASIANLFVRLEGRWWTPPLSCGLLPGVMRRHAIRSLEARPRVLRVEDLAGAEAILLSNSVRGLLRARFSHQVISMLGPHQRELETGVGPRI